jgi:hypothetical protein
MDNSKRILFFFLLPIIGVLAYPPQLLLGGIPVVIFAILMFAGLTYMLWRGNSRALTLAIFIQGLNVIIRIMMFFPHSVPTPGNINLAFMLSSFVAFVVSSYLVLRLDKPDVRSQMVT